VNKLSLLTVERHACEVTVTYGSKSNIKIEYPIRDEIVVMQQHSTGENLVVYRGFLAKGGKCIIYRNDEFDIIFYRIIFIQISTSIYIHSLFGFLCQRIY
jgi:hypothetical protein